MQTCKIGILSLQGGVVEHVAATKNAAKTLDVACEVVEVKRKGEFSDLNGLIIPGGESTTLGKLIIANKLWNEIRSMRNIFGTCAGAIMLAKNIVGQEEGGQETLAVMAIEVDRNAYGSQTESFEEVLDTKFGKINAIFIRAPKIRNVGSECEIIAKRANGEIVAVSERSKSGSNFYLATSFHPELSTTKFHEYFIRKVLED